VVVEGVEAAAEVCFFKSDCCVFFSSSSFCQAVALLLVVAVAAAAAIAEAEADREAEKEEEGNTRKERKVFCDFFSFLRFVLRVF
jgi:hypothetical protein